MRLPFLLLAALLMTTAPALAQKESNTEGSPVFGKSYCRPSLPCPRQGDPEKMADVERRAFSIATNCVKSRFSKDVQEKGFFQESYGLDSKLCLKSKKMEKGKSGLSITPVCCLQPTKKDPTMCQMVCTIYGLR